MNNSNDKRKKPVVAVFSDYDILKLSSLKECSKIFGRDIMTIRRHINNGKPFISEEMDIVDGEIKIKNRLVNLYYEDEYLSKKSN